MKNILHIISSPRGNDSYSFRLAQEMIKKITTKEEDCTLIEKHINPPFLSADQIISFYKNPADRNFTEKEALRYSDKTIEEIQNSDIIIISTPMYNMSIPASLKAWIDQVIRINVTFSYDKQRKKIGAFKGKKVYVAIASGRIHSTVKYKTDFIAEYLKIVFKPIGITDITFYRVEGTAANDFNPDYQRLIATL